ncbi:DUF5336 domain-containing protein [Actinophytocola xanthii]|uniref:DUF5336 domain-containing protein n=1 Tax=Actinophytocola xanthii TaxID=1912961 RepID=UPI0009F8E506|nr:DUF5336 domain-containing protein [Actinophytocola xanthii]
MTTLEWAGIGAGVLAFIVSFLPWVTLDFGDEFGDLGLSTSVSGSAWDAAFLGWFPILLLLGAAVVVALPHFGTQVAQRSMIWLGLAVAAFVFILLRWLTLDEFVAPGFGLFIGLVLALVSAVAAFLVHRAAPKPTTNPHPGTAYGA